MGDSLELSVGQCASLACLLEASAAKPGNVHRAADFTDLTFPDLTISGIAIAPAIEAIAAGGRVGAGILQAAQATRAAVATNSNLGMILLFGPLAAAMHRGSATEHIAGVLRNLDAEDCQNVYQAIAISQAGGLGKVAEADVHGQPPDDLLAAMRLAADRDLIARQYTSDFRDVFHFVLPNLAAGIAAGWSLADMIVRVHVQQMAEFPDSLIARKCGLALAQQSADHAAEVLAAGLPGDDNYHEALADLDFWLRSDGHRRNPGTSADMIAAGLFVALREKIIRPPYRLYPPAN